LPDGGSHSQQTLGNTYRDAFERAATAKFQVELPFQRIVDDSINCLTDFRRA
jgi:hypothetical protein